MTHLDLGLLNCRLFLLRALLFLFVRFVSEIDLDAKRVSELVDSRALTADNATNIVPVYLEFSRLNTIVNESRGFLFLKTHEAVVNLFVLGILHNRVDFFDCTINIGADTTNKDEVLCGTRSFLAYLDRQSLILSNNAVNFIRGFDSKKAIGQLTHSRSCHPYPRHTNATSIQPGRARS